MRVEAPTLLLQSSYRQARQRLMQERLRVWPGPNPDFDSRERNKPARPARPAAPEQAGTSGASSVYRNDDGTAGRQRIDLTA